MATVCEDRCEAPEADSNGQNGELFRMISRRASVCMGVLRGDQGGSTVSLKEPRKQAWGHVKSEWPLRDVVGNSWIYNTGAQRRQCTWEPSA